VRGRLDDLAAHRRDLHPGRHAAFSVVGEGSIPFFSRWQRETTTGSGVWADLTNGASPGLGTVSGAQSPDLAITGLASSAEGRFRCAFTNGCGTVVSAPAELAFCPADFNRDGFLDFFDYDDFVEAFESGDTRADFNRDGFLDFFDYDAFVLAFESGC
jgi:hypothetical protein